METQKQKGEGWVKGGEGLAKPFTAISVLCIVSYVVLVKGEGCFKDCREICRNEIILTFCDFSSFRRYFFMKAGGMDDVYNERRLIIKRLSTFLLYPDPGSNRDGLLHWCLRPARLPIPPSGQIALGLFAVAKVLIIFELTNFLGIFFRKKCILRPKRLKYCCICPLQS